MACPPPPAARFTPAQVDSARDGVAALPVAQREAIELYYFADLSCPKVAVRTATPLNTVKGRLRMARAHLRASLDLLAYSPD